MVVWKLRFEMAAGSWSDTAEAPGTFRNEAHTAMAATREVSCIVRWFGVGGVADYYAKRLPSRASYTLPSCSPLAL